MIRSYDLIVIGAGAGGLVVAVGAAKSGKQVLLIEKGNYGGDCTNFGCIPSKALIKSAEIAHLLFVSEEFGITTSKQSFNPNGALNRVRTLIQKVRHEEEPPALKALGVDTETGKASFEDMHTLCIDTGQKKMKVYGKRIVIATGSQPAVAEIKGLKETPFLTNETIFSLKEVPKTLIILGSGPIGCELAQAFKRLGAAVHLIASDHGLLPKEEPEIKALVKQQFMKENILLWNRALSPEVHYENGKFSIMVQHPQNKQIEWIQGDQLLVATGRVPQIENLDLAKAKVKYSEKGIQVDRYGRTSQKHIYALGDVLGSPFFTHLAEFQGRAVLRNLLLPWPFKSLVHPKYLPHVTFTDPEIASIGLSEEQAKMVYSPKKIKSYQLPFTHLDRALTSGGTEGYIKVVTKKWSGRILGATIAAPRAGEMLMELSLAMHKKISLRIFSSIIHPYPTYSAIIRKIADLWWTEVLLSMFRRTK